jgi:hypothetical protein
VGAALFDPAAGHQTRQRAATPALLVDPAAAADTSSFQEVRKHLHMGAGDVMIWLCFHLWFTRPPSYQPARRPPYVCNTQSTVLCHP